MQRWRWFVAGKEIAVKKYVVRLSAEERDRLEALSHAGKSSAQLLTKAHPAEGGRVRSGRRLERQRNLGGAGHQHRHYRPHPAATGRGGARGDAAAQIQSELRPAADFRRGGGGQIDRSGLLAGSRGVRPLEPAPA